MLIYHHNGKGIVHSLIFDTLMNFFFFNNQNIELQENFRYMIDTIDFLKVETHVLKSVILKRRLKFIYVYVGLKCRQELIFICEHIFLTLFCRKFSR